MADLLEPVEPAAGGPGAAPEGIGLDTERMRGAIAQRLFDAPAATPKIGRFVVIDTIGRGAMGTVVSAWDPQLDRRVAVKVLHGPPSDFDREQLLEEAKALARLNHPNVVTVHEAGLSDGRVYMAMEFVEGGTLREACEAIPIARRGRDRRVHAMFVDAARGLAAAHRVGLVHRDVKPTNMLIDDDGRLRLADFGLARAEVPITREGEADVELATTAGEHTAAAVARDRTGWVGTPAYMAPEQFDGRADERSDQFNLCASFWEIVYGRPPYAGSTLSETCGNVIDGRLQPASPASAVPPWLRRLLLRGIAVAPEDRFVDVATLLRALEVGRSRRHRRRWLAAIVVGSVGVAVAAFVGSRGEEDVTARCTAEAETRAPSFDDEQRARLAEAFRATGAAFAPAAWTKVSLQLDGWHARWREADVQACRAQTDPDGDTARKAAHQRGCLDRAAIAFASLTEALAEADTTTVPRASMAVHALPEPERCTEAGVERVLVDASPRLAAAAAELARAVTDRNLRRVDSAQRRLETVLESLTADADAAVRTYVHHELGAIANWRREDDAVLSFMRAALADAELSGDIEAQIDAWRVMSFAHARKAEPQAADFAIERMDSLARRAEVSVPTRARAEWGAASTLVELKRFDAAQSRFERALQAYERDIHTPMQIASLRCDYSEALFVQEHIDRATEQVRACREAQIEGLGPSHPYVAVASLQLSQYLFWAGDFQGAIEASDAARAILDENPRFSPSHRAFSYKLRGAANQRLGRHHEALADQQTALDLATEEQGPDSVDAVLARSDMSLTLGSLDRRDDARKMLEAAVDSASRNPAVRDSAKGTPRLNLASLLAEGGEHEAALEHLRHAREILDDVRPPSSSLSPSYWLTVAQVYRHCERFTEAREAMDRALASIETARVDEARRGAVLAEDARLLDAVGDTARATARIDEARDLLRAAGSPGQDALAQLDAWARERAGAPEPSR